MKTVIVPNCLLILLFFTSIGGRSLNMKKRAIISVAFAALTVVLCSCSMSPTYYSDDYVKTYAKDVFGKNVTFIEKTNDSQDKEGNLTYKYLFKEGRGIEFSIKTSTYRASFDGTQTSFYNKSISDDYVESIVSHYHDDITAIIKDSPFEIDYSDKKSMTLYLNDYKQTTKAAEFIEDIDKLLALESFYSKYNKSASTFTVKVYLRSDNSENIDNWKERDVFCFASIKLTTKAPRLTADGVNKTLERNLADKAKEDKAGYYSLPEDFLNKYPANVITLKEINGATILTNEYKFVYDEKTDKYWIYCLDPCQDCDEFSYYYTDRYEFSDLVKGFGGTYESANCTARWKIGSDVWTAKLYLGNHSKYADFKVKKNGELITLSDPGKKSNGTVSGRAFNTDDIEKMFGATLTIDLKTMTAVLKN